MSITSGMQEGGAIQAEFGDGVIYIVSGPKTYLETVEPMTPIGVAASGRLPRPSSPPVSLGTTRDE